MAVVGGTSYPYERRPGIWGNKGRDNWGSQELLTLVRQLQPEIVVNDRLDLPAQADVATPERYQPFTPVVVREGAGLWEACQTLNGSWGYDRDSLDWKTPDLLAFPLHRLRHGRAWPARRGRSTLEIGREGSKGVGVD